MEGYINHNMYHKLTAMLTLAVSLSLVVLSIVSVAVTGISAPALIGAIVLVMTTDNLNPGVPVHNKVRFVNN